MVVMTSMYMFLIIGFRGNFSFKGKTRKSQFNQPEEEPSHYSEQRYSNTVEMDDNRNELITEGEENVDTGHSQRDNTEKVRKTLDKKSMSYLHLINLAIPPRFKSTNRREELKRKCNLI